MNKTRIGLLIAAAVGLVPLASWAQGSPAGGDDGNAAAEASGDTAGGTAAGEGTGESAAGEAADGGEAAEGDEAEGGDDAGGLEDICKIDPAACPTVDFDKEARKPLQEQIFAVQQIYALRVRRFEITPYWGLTLNDQFVSHPGPGLAINYYIWNSFAVGLNGNYYRWFNVDSEFNHNVRRSARVGVPLNEYDWSAALNLSYVPIFGKFNGFGDFIFQYDAYLVLGGGFISTRPIPVFDPIYRNFDFKPKFAVNGGVGLRVFFYRWLAAVMEVRDYFYQEELEARSVANTTAQQQDKSTWMDDKKRWTHGVQAQIGASIFLPTTFEYRLPK